MPPELPNEQELILKKRARRRLVGAIALVLLMIIILPMILKDRAVTDPQEAIKISMPETKADDFSSTVVPQDGKVDAPKPEEGAAVDDSPAEEQTKPEPTPQEKTEAKPEVKPDLKAAESKAAEPKVEKAAEKPAPAKVAAKPAESKKPEPAKAPEPKVVEAKPAETVKIAESFTVQIGVFSDEANVKQLQDKLKQAGFSSHTEKISTAKGEKIRLRTGSYTSRQAADSALDKIKQAGLSGLVMPNT